MVRHLHSTCYHLIIGSSQTGIEYRDSSFLLNARNERRIPLNSVFIVNIGFGGVNFHRGSGKKGTFSVLLADTILVTKDGPKNLSTTDPSYKQVCIF
jgi:nucleosome binding factor SPN SPT16 subunit